MSRNELEWIEPLLWDAPAPVIREIYAKAKVHSRGGSIGRAGYTDMDIGVRCSYLRRIQQEFNRRLRVFDIMVEGVTW